MFPTHTSEMPGQQSLSYNQGAVSSVIFMVKNGRSLASRLFKHQDFSTVQNHVDDRSFLAPLAAPSPKLGDCLTFETYPDADGLLYTDFRCDLPGLVETPTGTFYNAKGTGGKVISNPPQLVPGSFTVDIGIAYNTVAAPQSPAYRYRIPYNPGFQDLLQNSDYACILGSTCSASTDNSGNPSYSRPINQVSVPPLPQEISGFFDVEVDAEVHDASLSTGSIDIPCPLWVDHVGYYLIEKLTVTQGSNFIQTFTGVDLFKCQEKWNNQETSDHYRIMTGGWKVGSDNQNIRWNSDDHREARSRRRLIVPLDLLYWVGKITQFLPIIGLSRPIQIKIQLRKPEYCYLFEQWRYTQTGSAYDTNSLTWVTPSIPSKGIPLQNVGLELHKFHVNQVVRTDFLAEMNNPQGLRWKCFDVEKQEDIRLSSGANGTKADIQLMGLKGGVTSLLITKIHADDKQTPFRTFWTNFLRVNDFSIQAGKDEIIPVTDHRYARYRMDNLYNVAKLSDYNIYMHSFNPVPNDKFNAWGHLEFGNLFNPVLTLNYKRDFLENLGGQPRPINRFSTGSPVDATSANIGVYTRQSTTSDHLVDIMALTHQFVQQKSGEVIRVFN